MATDLPTHEETFNAAVDTLIDAWVVYVNLIGANEDIQIVWNAPMKGATAADTTQGTAAGIKAGFDLARRYHWNNNPNTADNVPQSIAGRGLFFKVTDGTGNL